MDPMSQRNVTVTGLDLARRHDAPPAPRRSGSLSIGGEGALVLVAQQDVVGQRERWPRQPAGWALGSTRVTFVSGRSPRRPALTMPLVALRATQIDVAHFARAAHLRVEPLERGRPCCGSQSPSAARANDPRESVTPAATAATATQVNFDLSIFALLGRADRTRGKCIARTSAPVGAAGPRVERASHGRNEVTQS
jgi:hypothetical protein